MILQLAIRHHAVPANVTGNSTDIYGARMGYILTRYVENRVLLYDMLHRPLLIKPHAIEPLPKNHFFTYRCNNMHLLFLSSHNYATKISFRDKLLHREFYVRYNYTCKHFKIPNFKLKSVETKIYYDFMINLLRRSYEIIKFMRYDSLIAECMTTII